MRETHVDDSTTAVVVNISRSLRERGNDPQRAASFAWLPRSEDQREMLKEADIVVAVALNVVRGGYRVLSAAPYPDAPERIAWELQPLPAFAGTIGLNLSEDGPHWKPGLGAAWMPFPVESLHELRERAKRDIISFGPHFIQLLSDGNLILTLAEGYSVQVNNRGKLPRLRERIEPIVQLLGETDALTTYGTIADALNNSPQPVATSIAANENITQPQGARVLPVAYQQGDGWIIPANDMLTSQLEKPRLRGEILVEEGLATRLDDGSYFVDAGDVITDAASLRRFLKF